MSEDLNEVVQPSESETAQVESPESAEVDENEVHEEGEQPLSKEQKKILELKAQKKSLTEQKYRERQEKEALRAELEALRSASRPQEDQDLDTLIEQRVKERIYQQEEAVKTQEFDKACNKVFADGTSEFPDFENKITALSSIGLDRETLDYIANSGVGHKMLHYLANDLDEADTIMKMPVLRKAEALIKLKDKVSSQKKKISNTPEPIPAIGGKGGKVSIGNIADDYDAFNKWLETGLKKG